MTRERLVFDDVQTRALLFDFTVLGETAKSAALKVNAEQIKLYYDIGCEVLDRLEQSSWGDKVLESVSRDMVIELKTRRFKPQDLGQLSFYMTAVDRQVKSKQNGKTIGLLLCKSRNDVVVEYALSDMRRPMGVSTYQLGLPSTEELQKRLNAVLALPEKGTRKK